MDRRAAARALALLQSSTRHEDGTVLVHGDYWLGNLIVDRGQVVGVFDWELAQRGSPEEDRRFLADSLVRSLERDADFAAQVNDAVERGFARRPD